MFKKYESFTSCNSNINDTQVDNAAGLIDANE